MSFVDYTQFLKNTSSWFQLSRGNEIFAAAVNLISEYELADAGFFIYQRRLGNDQTPQPYTIYHPWGCFVNQPDLEHQLCFPQLEELFPYTEKWNELSETPFSKHWGNMNIKYVGIWPITSSDQNIGIVILAKYLNFKEFAPVREEERLLNICAYQISNAINSILTARKIEVINHDLKEQIQLRIVAETNLRRSQEFHILHSRANEAIALSLEETSLLQQICELAIEYTHLGVAGIGMPDEHGWFQFSPSAGKTEFLEGIKISVNSELPEGNGPVGIAWRTQRPVFYHLIENDPTMIPWRDRIAQFGMKSGAALPIYRGVQVWGILVIYHLEENAFDDKLQEILIDLAQDIGFGLDRLDLAKQERLANQFNDILLNSMTAGVNVMRYPERMIERVNPRMLKIYGAFSMNELVGHAGREFYPDEATYQRVGEFAKTVLSVGEGMLRDVPFLRLDGTVIYVDLSGQKYDRGDGSDRIIWTHVEVTERHQSELQIRELSRQKSLLLDNTLAGISLVRYPERVIAEANQRYAELMGYDRLEEVIGLSAVQIYPNEREFQRVAELSRIIMASGHGALRDLMIRSRNGEPKYLDVSGVLLEVDTEHPLILWTTIDVTERHTLMEQLEREALYDTLTGLPNRRYLESQLELALADAEHRKSTLAVIMIDLDGFKAVNDTFGHDQGDLVLKITGERFQHSIRQHDFVARMGGDEFVLILTDIRHPSEVTEILSRIGNSITAPIHITEAITVEVGLSAGVCTYPSQGVIGSNMVLRVADQALYKSKAHKNNREIYWFMAESAL